MSPVQPTIVFTGDSITESGRDLATGSLGDGYVAKLAAGPLKFARVVNAGVSGNWVRDVAARFKTDVLSEYPALVSIYAGINDTWHTFNSAERSPLGQFEQSFRSMLDALVDIPTVLVVPFVAPVELEQEAWAADLSSRQAVVYRLAAEYSTALVPLDALMRTAGQQHGNAALAADGVHPTPLGHQIIAEAWRGAAATRLAQLPRPA